MWGWSRPMGVSAMNSEFDLDPATEDVIRFLPVMTERAHAEGAPAPPIWPGMNQSRRSD